MNVLAREGEYWTVVFGGRVTRLRDGKGVRYLHHLLRRPGEEIHALALVGMADAPPAGAAAAAAAAANGLAPGVGGDAGTVLDAAAVAAYRRRFRELQDALADADDRGDGDGAADARYEMEALADQLAAGLGLGGRQRRAGSTSERARLAVTKAIRAAVKRMEQADPDLGRHLDRTVRTGTFCAYLPDPALDVTWRDTLPDDAAATPTPNAAPFTTPRRAAPRTPFVGRALERGLMHELVAAAAGGRGGLVLLTGEAGIGKTRLTEEAVAHAEARHVAWFVGRCIDADPPIAWLPVVEVLGQVVDQLDDGDLLQMLGGSGPEVARLVPSLRRRLADLPAPVDVPAEQARQYLSVTIRDLVLRLGADRPALVVLEDIHWADPATLTLLEHLADGLVVARVLVLATYRADEAALGTPLARTLERLVRRPACTTLALGPFGVREVADLVLGLTGQAPPDELAARLHADSDGNPLFAEELLKHHAAGRWPSDGALGLPDSLRLILGHRLSLLSPPCRDAVNLAAVVGRDVDVGLLRGALGGEGTLLDAIDEAVTAGVLVERTDGRDNIRLAFSHALLREAALAELSGLRRAALHLRAAGALRARHGDDPEHAGEIADHLERAGPDAAPSLVARYLELAGWRSLEAAAYEDAAARFARAERKVDAEDGLARARLRRGLGYALRGLSRPIEASQSWLSALDLLEASEDGAAARPFIADLSRALGRDLDATGSLDQAVAVLDRGLKAVGPAPEADRSRLLSALGYAQALAGDHAEAAACIAEASAIAEALDDDRLRADVLASRTSLEFAAGDVRACIATADAANHALLACGQVWDAVQARVTTVWPRLWLGQVGDARRLVEGVLPEAERIGHVAAAFLARRSAALFDLLASGDLDRFAVQVEEGVAICRERRLRWLADAHVLAGLARFWQGDWPAASTHLEAAATASAPPVYAGRYSATLLLFRSWAGDAEGFDSLAGELQQTFAGRGHPKTLGTLAVTLARVECLALLGRTEQAAACGEAVTAALDDGLVLRPPDLRSVHALAGLAAGLAGDRDRAAVRFAEARSVIAALPHRRQLPDIDFLEALASPGGRRPALLDRAIDGYGRLGMTMHRHRAEAERAAAAGH